MDWYLGCANDDFVVPSNQEELDMFPSPNDWSQWELSSSEAFEPKAKYLITQTTGVNSNGKIQTKVSLDLFEHEQHKDSINSNLLQEFKDSLANQETSSCDVSDYLLDDLDMTDQTDDVYLNSSHDIGSDTPRGEYNFYRSEFENDDCGALPSNTFFENTIMKSECDPSHLFGIGSSKYLKTHAFSPPVGGVSSPYTTQFPELADHPTSPLKAQYEEVSVSPEFEIMDEHMNVETSCEAFVLQEFENSMTQMSDHTRMCFRDALYRLAESSRQNFMDLVFEKSASLTISDGNLRSENMSMTEAETNTIDRAVANLMFCKNGNNVQNLPHCHLSKSGDAEVPIFR